MKAFVFTALLAVVAAAPQQFQFNNYPSQQQKTVYTKQVVQQTVQEQQPAVVQKSVVNQYVQQKPVQPPIAITSFERNVKPAGDYQFSYGTEHGININEDAKIKEIRDEKNEPHHVPAVTGSYSYVGDDGQTYTVNYIADEFGFRASGAHLPQPHPIPADIKKSIESLPPLPKDEPVQEVQQQSSFQQSSFQQQQQQQPQYRFQQFKQFSSNNKQF